MQSFSDHIDMVKHSHILLANFISTLYHNLPIYPSYMTETISSPVIIIHINRWEAGWYSSKHALNRSNSTNHPNSKFDVWLLFFLITLRDHTTHPSSSLLEFHERLVIMQTRQPKPKAYQTHSSHISNSNNSLLPQPQPKISQYLLFNIIIPASVYSTESNTSKSKCPSSQPHRSRFLEQPKTLFKK